MAATMIRPPSALTPEPQQRTASVLGGGPSGRYQRCHRPQPSSAGNSSRGRAVPNYAARRFLAVLVLGAVTAVAVPVAAAAPAAVAAVFGGSPAVAANGSADGASSAASVPTRHVVQPGDTLWSIAAEYRGDVGHADYLDALIARNGGTTIQLGQAVILP